MTVLGQRTLIRAGLQTALVLAAVAWAGTPTAADEPLPLERTAPLPEPLVAYTAARDGSSGRVVVFGGVRPGGAYGDKTYLWDGSAWTSIESGPEPRSGQVMAGLGDGVLLFGGLDANGRYRDDTWVFANGSWRRIPTAAAPPARAHAALAYDPASGDAILLGGFNPATGDLNDTWVFRDETWRRVFPKRSPSPRGLAAFAFQPGGDGLLVGGFGDRGGELTDLPDLWRWHDGEWEPIEGEPLPPARSNARVVALARDRSLLIYSGFGGGNARADAWLYTERTFRRLEVDPIGLSYADIALVDNADTGGAWVVVSPGAQYPDPTGSGGRETQEATYLNDTWLFDGTRWRPIPTDVAPSGRAYAQMAYDPDRDVLVLFGGGDGQHTNNDTWEFDGTRWRRVDTSSAPAPRVDHRLVYDAASRSMLCLGGFGGADGASFQNDAWRYANGDWSPVVPPSVMGARARFLLEPSADGLVLGFGLSQEGEYADTSVFTGGAWKAVVGPRPPRRVSSTSAYLAESKALVLFGGASRDRNAPFRDTWLFQDGGWIENRSPGGPAGRLDAAMAALPGGRAALLFGGFDNLRDLGDTWVFDGRSWRALDSDDAPSPRSAAAVATLGKRGVVLFGGIGPAQRPKATGRATRETWEFDGESWRRIPTANSPSSVMGHGLGFDPKRRQAVLFGGFDERVGELDETWVFDGTDWRRIPTAHTPAARTSPNLAWDARRKRIVLYGGHSQRTGALDDVWTFDGTDWTRLPVTGPPSPFSGGQNMVYNPKRRVFWLYGVMPAQTPASPATGTP